MVYEKMIFDMINKYKSHKSENIFLIEWTDIALKSNMEKALFSFFVFITFIFVLIHSLSVFGISAPNSFPKEILRITTDQGYAEYFQYMLLIGTCYFIISIFNIFFNYFYSKYHNFSYNSITVHYTNNLIISFPKYH